MNLSPLSFFKFASKSYFKIVIMLLLAGFSMNLSAQKKPDILFFITDDMGYYECSLFSKTDVRTPSIQQFAKGGITFKNAFVASPSCAPSRGALLTGLMPAKNGAEANHSYPKENIPILTKKLQQEGYLVVAIGKIAHGTKDNNCGWDYSEDAHRDLAQKVESFFKNKTFKQPICLLVGDRLPHAPWTDSLLYNPEKINMPNFLIDTKETRHIRAKYYSDITNMDTDFGKILKTANQYLSKDRITIFSSDHGAQWNKGKWNLYDAGIRTPLIIQWPKKIKANLKSDAMVSWIDIFPTIFDLIGIPLVDSLDGKSFKNTINNPTLNHRSEIFTTHTGDGNINVYPMRSVRNERYKLIMNIYPDNVFTNHTQMIKKKGVGSYWDSWEEKAKTDSTAKRIINKFYYRPAFEFYDLKPDPNEQKNEIENPFFGSIINQLKESLNNWMIAQNDKKTLSAKPYLKTDGIPIYKKSKNQNLEE